MSLKFLLVNFFLLLAFFGMAHEMTLAASQSDIAVDVTPADYGPSENTTITLSSFSANLDTALISWYVNGKISLSGIGKRSFSITSGVSGSQANVLARIALPDGEIQKVVLIRPNVMTLLWQANDSYVPPFYKGKAMSTLGSEIKIVAMPEIRIGSTMADPKTMTYAWKKDSSNDTEASGYSKNSFIYSSDYLDSSNDIEVTASTTNGQYSSTDNISVAASSAEISFYKKDNDLGILWESEVQNGHITQNGEILVAIPYFISPKQIQSPRLVWSWFINDAPVSMQSSRRNLLPLRVEEGTTGTSKLGLEIENKDKVFETADKEIELQF